MVNGKEEIRMLQNDNEMKEIESGIVKAVGGHCDDFEFEEIYNYHGLLKCIGLELHDDMPSIAIPACCNPVGGYIKEKHYVAHTFPNGDVLSRIEIYCYDENGNLEWHKPYSAIYCRDKNGELTEMVNHERKRELGMVLYYMEHCIANKGKYL
jgi:hypothetical protein